MSLAARYPRYLYLACLECPSVWGEGKNLPRTFGNHEDLQIHLISSHNKEPLEASTMAAKAQSSGPGRIKENEERAELGHLSYCPIEGCRAMFENDDDMNSHFRKVHT